MKINNVICQLYSFFLGFVIVLINKGEEQSQGFDCIDDIVLMYLIL